MVGVFARGGDALDALVKVMLVARTLGGSGALCLHRIIRQRVELLKLLWIQGPGINREQLHTLLELGFGILDLFFLLFFLFLFLFKLMLVLRTLRRAE